jgi:alpha-tubulin suppressor-like RCC1 family protein
VCFGFVVLAGCGRVGFDALADAAPDGSLGIAGPSLTAARRCTGPFIVDLLDATGAPEPSDATTTVEVTGGMSGRFFTDSGCTTTSSMLAIGPGEANTSFYFQDALAEQPTLTATANGRASGSLSVSVRMIAAGDQHTCVAYEGKLACWGRGNEGQLGLSGTANAMVPTRLPTFSSGVVAVSAGGSVTCAIVNGGAWCWGANNTGQLGNGTVGGMAMVPGPVQDLNAGVTAIAAGDRHACGLVGDAAWCWGYNMEGEVGIGTFTAFEPPTAVPGLDKDVEVIATGYDHTCVIVHGVAACWGHNDNAPGGSPFGYVDAAGSTNMYGQPVSNLATDAAYIEVAGFHTCAVMRSGAAWCWGAQGGTFNLGDGTTNDSTMPRQPVGLSSGVTDVTLGQSNNPGNCVVRDRGAYCWGQNTSGSVGDNSLQDKDRPTAVINLGSGVMAIATGEDHACALVDDGSVACWGAGVQGQLGDGVGAPSPTRVFTTALP